MKLIIVFAFLILLCVLVAIDQYKEQDYTLGDEWDFTRTNFKPKCIDNNK